MKEQLKLLLKIRKLLIDNNIEYWLAYGTLLGAIREKNFLSHDTHDIDIGLNQKDYWKVRDLLEKQNVLKYKRIWRTEIALYENKEAHIDLFFYTEKDNMMCSSAFLRNKIQGGINIESGMHFLKTNIYPLKTIKMLGHKFSVPAKPEAHLKENYGDWKTSDKHWCHGKLKSFNEDHRTIGILITTFLRDEQVMKSIKSILKQCESNDMFRKWVRIYVADQGKAEWSEKKTNFYKKLEEDGHKIYKTPFDSGLSYNRNFLVQKSNEPYLMIIDDDFEFTEHTDIASFIEILNHRENNGIVGGDIENRPPYHADLIFEIKNDMRYLHRIQRLSKLQKAIIHSTSCDYTKNTEVKYYYTDIVLNFFLAKREVLEEVPLDNNLKLVEHTDHFLRIKQTNKWNVCYYPKTTCRHLKNENSIEYKNFRNNPIYTKMFLDKWNFKNEKHLQRIFETSIDKITCNEIKNKEKIKIVQIARIPCANSGYELSQLINKYSTKYESKYILGSEYAKTLKHIPYRQFPYELFWKEDTEKCIKAIQEADIVHVHHDIWPELIPYLKDKKIVSTVYNLTNSLQYNDNEFNRQYLNKLKELGIVTVADQPLQKKMFSDISSIHVPLVKMLFDYYYEKGEIITVGYSPTNREDIGIGSKRFSDVMRIVESLQHKYNFRFDLIEGVPYEENLKRKSKCHILIDDVDDKYEKAHNTTLEASLFNAVALTNYTGKWFPAIKTDIYTLEQTLEKFLNNSDELKAHIEKLKEWKRNVYNSSNILNIYENLYSNMTQSKSSEITSESLIYDSYKERFNIIYDLLENNDITCVLTQKTCLDAVKYGKPENNNDKIHIGVDDFQKAKQLLMITKNNKNICLENYKGKTKKLGYCGTARNVPFPVIGYLDREYNKKWRDNE